MYFKQVFTTLIENINVLFFYVIKMDLFLTRFKTIVTRTYFIHAGIQLMSQSVLFYSRANWDSERNYSSIVTYCFAF